MRNDELYHYGIKGMKWGVRRYQNEDGSLTEKGKKRYSDRDKYVARLEKKSNRRWSTAAANKLAVADLKKNGTKSVTFKRYVYGGTGIYYGTAGEMLVQAGYDAARRAILTKKGDIVVQDLMDSANYDRQRYINRGKNIDRAIKEIKVADINTMSKRDMRNIYKQAKKNTRSANRELSTPIEYRATPLVYRV